MNCKNFTGIMGRGGVIHETCEAGHRYDSFGPRLEYRRELPCIARNERLCPDQDFPTREEMEQREKEFDEHFRMITTARALIVAQGGPGSSGSVECPKCKGVLLYSIAGNRHVHAQCETAECLAWIE